MKLTREQVSALTATELNRAMIWCYGDSHPTIYLVGVEDFGNKIFIDMGEGYDYSPNYLTDYNLTMPLLESNRVSLINISGTTQWFSCNNVSFENICMSPDGSDNGLSCMDASNLQYNTKPLRAICEVLLMIKMMEVK